jgi:hypothetical protein
VRIQCNYGVLFLTSDETSFVTGSELVIDSNFSRALAALTCHYRLPRLRLNHRHTSCRRLPLPGGKPLPHPADMASRPTKPAAFGAHLQRTTGTPGPFRDPRRRIGRSRLENWVVDEATAEWRMQPVDNGSDA